MRYLSLTIALSLAVSGAALAQSSNTSSNSSSNNGVVRERTVDTYCDGGYCTHTVERNVYRDRPNYGREDRYDRRQGERRRFSNWALRNFDYDRDGRLSRREHARALDAYYRR